jgi:pilus biogenesis lipoprotein CpaD
MTMFFRFLSRFDLALIMLALVAASLAACDMKGPSVINVSPIQVQQQDYAEMVPSASVNFETARLIADDYKQRGTGAVDVTVTYLAGQKDVKAVAESKRIAGLLNKTGLKQVANSTLPVNDADAVGQVMINYTRLAALPPADCQQHPAETRDSIANSEDGRFSGYRIGCGIDSYMAQQISRPKDLIGSDDMKPATADRYGNALKDYKEGKPYKDLKSQNASETTF